MMSPRAGIQRPRRHDIPVAEGSRFQSAEHQRSMQGFLGTGSKRQDRLTRAWGHRYVSTCLWCSGLDARTGSELGLVSVMHKPHARDPLQLLSGVHLPGDRAGPEPSSPPAAIQSRPQVSLPTPTLASWSSPLVLLITHSTAPHL